MRKSKAGTKKVQPRVDEVFDDNEVFHMPPVSSRDVLIVDAPLPARVAEPLPHELAASRLQPFTDVSLTHYDAWLLFQVYHLSEQTLLLRSILQAVEV